MKRPETVGVILLRAFFYTSVGLLIAALMIAVVRADGNAKKPLRQTPAQVARSWVPTDDVRNVGDFWISFDGQTKNARYVVEYLDGTDSEPETDRHSGFRQDDDLPVEFRPSDSDYAGSGFDRGHLAASANHLGTPEANYATFLLSNVAPQHPGLNRRAWKRLESLVRDTYGNPVIIFTAPLYLPDESGRIRLDTIGTSRIWVPTHFGKAILTHDKSGVATMAHWICPNVDTGSNSLDVYRVTGDEFEAAVGLDLWAPLPDEIENRLEAAKP